MKVRAQRYWIGAAAIVVSIVVFVVPFAFIVLTAVKDRKEASLRHFSLPVNGFHLWDNLVEVVQTRDYMLLTAFINSIILTVGSVILLVTFGAMVGFVLQRRPSRWTPVVNFLVLAGLIIPPAVVPTIWVLQGLDLFKTLHGLILIEVAYGLSFTILLFRAFVATIPRELDEAAIMDGAGPLRLFFQVILPLLRPVVVTVVVVQSVAIFNDFTYPLYYLPGRDNVTVQLTLYNFQKSVQHILQSAVCKHSADHYPTASCFPFLQSPDRGRNDRRRRQRDDRGGSDSTPHRPCKGGRLANQRRSAAGKPMSDHARPHAGAHPDRVKALPSRCSVEILSTCSSPAVGRRHGGSHDQFAKRRACRQMPVRRRLLRGGRRIPLRRQLPLLELPAGDRFGIQAVRRHRKPQAPRHRGRGQDA